MATSPAGLSERLLHEFASVAAQLTPERIAPERRAAALQRIAALGLPQLRDDYWRYASLRPLEKARFAPAKHWGGSYDAAVLGLPPLLPQTARRVFVDGRHVASLASAPQDAGLQFTAPVLQVAPAGEVARDLPSQRFAFLNEAFLEDGATLRVPAGGSASLEVIFIATGADPGAASYPRLDITLEPDARLTLIERHIGSSGEGSLVNCAVHAQLGRGAQLNHYRLQACAQDVVFLDSLLAQVDAGAHYCLTLLGLGAQSARSSLRIDLAGREASTRVRAMALADQARVLDLAVLVEHAAPATRSTQVFRGIGAQRARVSCNSQVLVAEGAAGADSRQSLKGLMSGNAEINLRPQLEILTDDVKASHGATTGALDENTLFYLLSRGIDRDTARVLLEWAFLEDVLAQIEIAELRREVERSSVALLGSAPALQELL